MAGTLLHISVADEVLRALPRGGGIAGLPTGPRARDFRLGSVLVDLPYYEGLAANGVRMALGQELRAASWGLRFHEPGASRFPARLLRVAGTDAERALALGAFTHLAVDRVFHPEIDRRVREMNDGRDSFALHRRVEDELDLHAHEALLGHGGIGRPYTARAMLLHPTPGWSRPVRRAARDCFGEAPSPGQLWGWLLGMWAFGALSSSPRAPWVKPHPDDDPPTRELAQRLLREAVDSAAALVEEGLRFLAGAPGVAEPEGLLAAGRPRDPS